jgi:hypothetical protein
MVPSGTLVKALRLGILELPTKRFREAIVAVANAVQRAFSVYDEKRRTLFTSCEDIIGGGRWL